MGRRAARAVGCVLCGIAILSPACVVADWSGPLVGSWQAREPGTGWLVTFSFAKDLSFEETVEEDWAKNVYTGRYLWDETAGTVTLDVLEGGRYLPSGVDEWEYWKGVIPGEAITVYDVRMDGESLTLTTRESPPDVLTFSRR